MARQRPVRTALIIGMRARKDWRGFIEALAPAVDEMLALALAEECAEPETLAAHARALGLKANAARNVSHALAQALANGARRVLICGSLLLAGEALEA
jgi:dihydrofolate synthase/folylpolyglutamate synthase